MQLRGMYIHEEPITFIQSMPQNELTYLEMFPLSKALGAGNHLLTVSIESLDGVPITAALNTVGFYYAISQPIIDSASITTGGFEMTWEAGTGGQCSEEYLPSTHKFGSNGTLSDHGHVFNTCRFYRLGTLAGTMQWKLGTAPSRFT